MCVNLTNIELELNNTYMYIHIINYTKLHNWFVFYGLRKRGWEPRGSDPKKTKILQVSVGRFSLHRTCLLPVVRHGAEVPVQVVCTFVCMGFAMHRRLMLRCANGTFKCYARTCLPKSITMSNPIWLRGPQLDVSSPCPSAFFGILLSFIRTVFAFKCFVASSFPSTSPPP